LSKLSKKPRLIPRRHPSMKKIGTLAAAASLAAACEGYAEVVLVPINETIPAGSLKTYDLDSDGFDDITFDSTNMIDILMWAGAYSTPSGSVTAGVVIDPDNPGYLLAHQACDSIPKMLGVTQDSGVFPAIFFDQNPVQYAGFWFCPDSLLNRHYAWVEANVHSASGDLEILAFGYEDQPETPILTGSCATGVSENVPSLPLTLLQNSPNPFSSQTKIGFELPSAAVATIGIYDVSGRLVKKIESVSAHEGFNAILWDGRDTSGRDVVSGIYFYRLEALGATQSRRMVIIR